MALETKILKIKISLIPDNAKTLAALDRGCSVTKSMYINKHSPTENVNGEDYYVFQLELWKNADFEKAIDQIRDHALLPQSGVMPVSGIGGDTYKKIIEEKIKLRVQFQDEFKSHASGILFCKKELNSDEYSEVVDERLPIKAILKSSPHMDDIKMLLDSIFCNQVEFPILFVVMGSATQVHKIYENGTSEILCTSFVGGSTFMSMAKLLLGTVDYNEVIRLAEAGDRKYTDSLIRDIIDITDEDNPYGDWNPDYPVNFFGNSVLTDRSISEYKKEDLARSLVASSASNAVTIIGHLAKGEGIKDILIGGSMAKSKLVRMEMMDALKRDSFGIEYLNFRFLKFAHSSALGTLLRADPDNTAYYNP